MLIKERLETYPFSDSEQRIVDYVLEQQRGIENKTTTQIAKETFSSKSTLVRIAQKLNYSGWNELKEAFLQEVDYLEKFVSGIDANYPFTQKDSIMSISAKIATLEKEAIDDTLSLLTHDELRKAINILFRAKTIHLFAVSNNLLITQEFRHNMSRIKKDVRIHALQSEVVFDAFLAEPDSCAIIVTYSGETSLLHQVSELLKEKQIPIVLITGIGDNTATKSADCVLRICTREKLYSKIATYSTDASITYLLDVLYSCVFSLNYEANTDLRKNAATAVEKGRSASISIQKE